MPWKATGGKDQSGEVLRCAASRAIGTVDYSYGGKQATQRLARVEREATTGVGIGEASIRTLDAQQPVGQVDREIALTVLEKGRNQISGDFRVRPRVPRLDANAAGRENIGVDPRQRARRGRFGTRHERPPDLAPELRNATFDLKTELLMLKKLSY